ncbi:MAG: redoxin family protein [Alphaproteobacteria bacterium]|nr:redoxin family protein [Alphaproteobacteria bacterium SS10]
MSDEAPIDPVKTERRLLVWLPAALVLLLVVGFAIALSRPAPDALIIGQLDTTLQERALPEFSLDGTDADGPIQGLDIGAVLSSETPFKMVNFFASWCAPCRIEHPYLMALARRDDLTLFGIAYRDRPEAAADYLVKAGNPFEAAGLDPLGKAALGFGITGMPETFVIDRAGMIRFRFQGPITDIQIDQLDAVLAQIEQESVR